ncbi:MAG: ATP-binding protein [Thermoleophilia bacterium]
MTPSPAPATIVPPDELVSAFRVPAQLESLTFVRCALAMLLERQPQHHEGAGRLLLAAAEAVSNAIEHGSPEEGGHVEVRVVTGVAGARLEVVDEGRPGHPAVIDLEAPTPEPSSTRGRGIVIMRTLADRVSVEPVGAGTRVAMSFIWDRAHPMVAVAA